MYTVNETYKNIEAEFKPRSKWDHGVKDTELALLDSLDMPETVLPDHFESRRALLLNGADNWREYSYGGCALVYNVDIAARFFTPSELRRYMADGHDASMAFRGESMLDLQARALRQEECVISRYAREH